MAREKRFEYGVVCEPIEEGAGWECTIKTDEKEGVVRIYIEKEKKLGFEFDEEAKEILSKYGKEITELFKRMYREARKALRRRK